MRAEVHHLGQLVTQTECRSLMNKMIGFPLFWSQNLFDDNMITNIGKAGFRFYFVINQLI